MDSLIARLLFLILAPLSLIAAPALTDSQRAVLSHSHRTNTNGWINVQIQGAASDRGFQHGYLLAREIAEEIRVRQVIWKYETSFDWPYLVEKSTALFEPRIDPENLAELDGIVEGMRAAGVQTTRGDLIAYNGFFELHWYWWPKELKKIKDDSNPPKKQACSSFIATGSMTRDGQIVLGHDTFFGYPEATANIILDIRPDHGHRILMQTYPGWIHSGTDFFITDAGLVGSETTIGGLTGFDEHGVPEFVRFRRATQDANNIDQWCDIMRRGNNGGYANAWLLGDINTREIARLELALKHVAFEKKTDGYFVGSNTAEDLQILRLETDDNELDIRNSAIARRQRWHQLMPQNKGKIDIALGQKLLADHYDIYLHKNHPGSRTLCGHSELNDASIGSGTPFSPGGCFDAKLVDSTMAKNMTIAARWGAACGTPFDAQKFLAAHPQYDWMQSILKSRPRQPWTQFSAKMK